MTEEMTRAGMEAEARRRYEESKKRAERAADFARCVIWALVILGGTAILLLVAHIKREERDARAELEHAHYEMVAAGVVTGGAK